MTLKEQRLSGIHLIAGRQVPSNRGGPDLRGYHKHVANMPGLGAISVFLWSKVPFLGLVVIYVDESGDLGWQFDQPFRAGGASRYLTVACLIVPSPHRRRGKGDFFARFLSLRGLRVSVVNTCSFPGGAWPHCFCRDERRPVVAGTLPAVFSGTQQTLSLGERAG